MQNQRTFLVKTSATMKAYDWLLNPAFKRTKFKKGAEIALRPCLVVKFQIPNFFSGICMKT